MIGRCVNTGLSVRVNKGAGKGISLLTGYGLVLENVEADVVGLR